MVTKGVSITVACAMLLVSSGGSRAAEYRPGEFFSLDLPSAVLSPKPFGPLTEFKPAPSAATADHIGESAKASAEASTAPTSQASREPKASASKVTTSRVVASTAVASRPKAMASKTLASKAVASKTEPRITVHNARVVQLRMEKPHGAARTKLARRHTNPLDAQALDTRIQVWPCRSGGICDWKR